MKDYQSELLSAPVSGQEYWMLYFCAKNKQPCSLRRRPRTLTQFPKGAQWRMGHGQTTCCSWGSLSLWSNNPYTSHKVWWCQKGQGGAECLCVTIVIHTCLFDVLSSVSEHRLVGLCVMSCFSTSFYYLLHISIYVCCIPNPLMCFFFHKTPESHIHCSWHNKYSQITLT